jgi:Peptidase family S41
MLALVLACGVDKPSPADGGAGGQGGEGGQGGTVEPPVTSEDWCDRFEPGVTLGDEAPLAWSAAHAHLRFFSVVPSREQVDGALVAALAELGDEAAQTERYVDTLGPASSAACPVPAGAAPLGATEVTLEGELAIVRPGTGSITIPAEAEAIAVDLRDLPSGAAAEEALFAVTGAIFASPVEQSRTRVREHHGMFDEVFSYLQGIANVYESSRLVVELEPWPGEASADRPVALLTDPELAPAAARLALAARLGERATIIGTNVMAQVAESRWFGIGTAGLAVRDRELVDAPNVVPADRLAGDPVAEARAWLDEGAPAPAPLAPGADDRPGLVAHDVTGLQPDVHSVGAARAVATIVHGAARLFFPYFPVVGDTIDTGLADAYAVVAEGEGDGTEDFDLMVRALRSVSYHLHDSHTFLVYVGDHPATHTRVPVLLDAAADGSVLVRNSELAALPPGHRLVAIDGEPVQDVIAGLLPVVAASASSAIRNVLDQVRWIGDTTSWTVMDPSNATSDVVIEPSALPPASATVDQMSARQAGTLDDLGRPDVYYVNLDGASYAGNPAPNQVVANAEAAGTLVLDARGYPGHVFTWTIIERVLLEPTAVHFNVPWQTPFGGSMELRSQPWNPAGPSFSGPVYVLIAPHTQSQAEHILMPLASTSRATFVGRPTAGTNGNITGVMLPGSFGLTFTGMEVLFADMSTFHGQGISPDILAHPTVVALAAGEDPELMQALAVIP